MKADRARESRPVGLRAESLAEEHLARNGYVVLARNHHSREGEVDLVAEKDQLVVFVEVKARKARALVDPLASVTPAKQRKVVRAALDFLQKSGLEQRPIRFDVVAITLPLRGGAPQLEHLENAFDASAGDAPGDW